MCNSASLATSRSDATSTQQVFLPFTQKTLLNTRVPFALTRRHAAEVPHPRTVEILFIVLLVSYNEELLFIFVFMASNAYGFGNLPCANYLEIRKKNLHTETFETIVAAAYIYYTIGRAHEIIDKNNYSLPDPASEMMKRQHINYTGEEVLKMVEKGCREKPEATARLILSNILSGIFRECREAVKLQ